jgi:macrolide transport system ATP-binding/permease protein
MPRLRLRSIDRRFGGTTPIDALKSVSLQIEQGEFIAIEGESGGGKSTLLNIIGLLDEPTGGSYSVGEVEIASARSRTIAELRSDRFAFIFQSFHLLDRRPVIDSVELGLIYRAVPRSERRALALAALREVGLGHLAWQTASKLSGGQRQRVAIARALATHAPIVVADEPTGNLDSTNSDAVVESLRTLHRSGATIVLVTHSPDVAAAATRRVRIRDGQLIGDSQVGPSLSIERAEPTPPPGRASRLMFRDLMIDAFDSVRSRLGRSAGLVAAVALGVSLAVATLGISVSAGAQVSDTFNAHTNRDVTVEWHSDDLSDQSTANQLSIVPRLEQLHGLAAVGLLENFSQHSVRVGPARRTFQITVYAITRGTPEASRSTVHWVPGHNHELAAGEVLLGANLAKQLEIGPLVGSPRLAIDGRNVAVVGIVTTSPRVPDMLGSVLAPTIDRNALGHVDVVKAIILTTTGAAQQVSRQAPFVINPFRPQTLTVNAPADPSTLRSQIESAVQSTLLALTAVALLASVAGLTNAMVLSVIERKQEFGLRRALGGRPFHIASLVITESTLIGAIGGIVGLLVGLAGILVVTLARHWSPVFDLRLAPIAILGGIVVGGIGGILASARASRIQPNEALRL